MQLNTIDQLVHTTVRIECYTDAGEVSCGTGFFYTFCEEDGRAVPAIVTNKHVIDGSDGGIIRMSIYGPDGARVFGQHVELPIFEDKYWIKHPDPNIDLAAFPIGYVHKFFKAKGIKPFYITMHRGMLASTEFLNELNAIEDVVMIGYPNGLWDATNNLPLVRRGITATPAYVDFEGRSEFMIDCACFPGSSGSPVLLYNVGSYVRKAGGLQIGSSRIKLLGVLWGGAHYTAEGRLEVRPVPTAVNAIALSRIPNNLGYCVKAMQLLALEEHLKKVIPPDADAPLVMSSPSAAE
jgi:hypothetical protein